MTEPSSTYNDGTKELDDDPEVEITMKLKRGEDSKRFPASNRGSVMTAGANRCVRCQQGAQRWDSERWTQGCRRRCISHRCRQGDYAVLMTLFRTAMSALRKW
jgi:hypothetical protein